MIAIPVLSVHGDLLQTFLLHIMLLALRILDKGDDAGFIVDERVKERLVRLVGLVPSRGKLEGYGRILQVIRQAINHIRSPKRDPVSLMNNIASPMVPGL